MSGSCPDAEVLVELARGTLPAAIKAGAEAHIAGCEECRDVLATFTRSAQAPTLLAPGAAPVAHLPDGRPAGVVPGEIVGGKYRIERVLGSGGMGMVVLATHTQLGQKVALKLMLPSVRPSAEASARFLREARAAVQIQSEHVARVMDMGTLDSGAPFIVMEFLKGVDLAELVRVRGALPVEDTLDYVLQACEALAEAHGNGIVHRDLKPANLFLSARPDGSALLKVLDFGISKYSGLGEPLSEQSLTHGHAIMGSPRYMSPEQMQSSKWVDQRTDVWALGCILYELLTARPTFTAETPQGLCAVIAASPTPSVRAVRHDVPEEIDRVIFACLEKDPARRMPSVADLVRRLAPLAPRRAQVSVERVLRMSGRVKSGDDSIEFARTIPSVPPPAFGPSPTDQSFARSSPEASSSQRKRSFAPVAVGLTLAIVGISALAVTHGRRPKDVEAATPVTIATSAVAQTEAPVVVAPPAPPPAAVSVLQPPPAPVSTTISPTRSAAAKRTKAPVVKPTVATESAPAAPSPENGLLDRK